MNVGITEIDSAFVGARGRVLDSQRPSFLVDPDGIIVAWNSRAAGFFGIPAWSTSAHHCASVVQGRSRAGLVCSDDCPLLHGGGALTHLASPMAFAVRGVPGATMRHELVRDPDGRLLGIIHELLPIARRRQVKKGL